MKKISIVIGIVLIVFVMWAVTDPRVNMATEIENGDTNEPNTSEWLTIEYPKPTHRCPVHGELGGDWITVDFIYVNNTTFCAECAYTQLEAYLKANIPQLTEIDKENQ
jgi:hypothetical protein